MLVGDPNVRPPPESGKIDQMSRFQFSLGGLMSAATVSAGCVWIYRALWQHTVAAVLMACAFAVGACIILYATRLIGSGCMSAWPVLVAMAGILIAAVPLCFSVGIAFSFGWR